MIFKILIALVALNIIGYLCLTFSSNKLKKNVKGELHTQTKSLNSIKDSNQLGTDELAPTGS